jgi:hypothetical protein
MNLSVVYLTYRPGGIGLFGRSLVGQNADYELLVIDDFPGRVGRGRAQKFLLDLGLPVSYYGPSKPKSFPDTYQGLFNAMNTAVLHATGDWVLFVHDYSWLPPGVLENWRNALRHLAPPSAAPQSNFLVHGVGMMYGAPAPDVCDDVDCWEECGKVPEAPVALPFKHLPFKWKWQPAQWELFYFAAPMRYLEATNGFDERADHAGVYILESMIEQAKLHDYRMVVDDSLVVNLIDHRVWESPQTNLLEKKGQWRIPAEAHSHPGPHVWAHWSANPFNLVEERRLLNV